MKNYQILLCENKSATTPILLGDFNKNGVIDEADVDKLDSFLKRHLYESIYGIDLKEEVDFNGDGKLDIVDLAIFENYLSVKDEIEVLEGIWEEGKSPTPEERVLRFIDFNKNGIIDEEDYQFMEHSYRENEEMVEGVNLDGKEGITETDWKIFLYYWKISQRGADPRQNPLDEDELQQYITHYNNSLDIDLFLADIDENGEVDSDDLALLRLALKDSSQNKYFYPATQSFIDQIVCEIGSLDSASPQKAVEPIFYTKIDGTHELSFSLPRFYLDTETGEYKINELVELVTNKSKIILKDLDTVPIKEYHLFVNDRQDKDDGGSFTYIYTCNDAFIEELSKTGYGLTFTDEVNGIGFGTIHELAEKILEDTDWKYMKDKTGNLGEYKTDVEYKIEQQRYDTVQIPVPVHPVKYIPELERYCNVLSEKYQEKKIYCYEDTEQIVSSSVSNLLYNSSNFIDITGWMTYRQEKEEMNKIGVNLKTYRVKETDENTNEEKYSYYLRLSPTKNILESKLLNDTAADANKSISANQPYAFRVKTAKGSTGKITGISIYSENPLTANAEPDYSLSFGEGGADPNNYYVIKTNTSFFKPYVVFDVQFSKEEEYLDIESFSLFEIKGKNTAIGEKNDNSEENNLDLLSSLTNGEPFSEEDIYSQDHPDRKLKMYLPTDVISAYTHKKVLYFIRENENTEKENDNGTLTYLDFREDINPKISIHNVSELPLRKNINFPNQETVSDIYYLETDGKYYQYYELRRHNVTGGAWDLALLGDGTEDKRRTLVANKSNRFNLLQQLSELFKVWCVFDIVREEDGTVSKQVWFRENAVKENFAGFHKNINLKSIERKQESDEIVTKMFVEDVENKYAENGFVTIRTARSNPWGENYYYNFKHYVDQHLMPLNGDGEPCVDNDLKILYEDVKVKNNQIFELNDKVASMAIELSNLRSSLKSISYCVAGALEKIVSLNADLENYEEDSDNAENISLSISSYEQQRDNYSDERDLLQAEYDTLKAQYDALNDEIKGLQNEKLSLIKNFETTYAPFIKEGVWSDKSYVDNETYYLDSQKVSNTSAVPKTTWTINVLDGSVYEDLEDFKFEVGDQTILVDNDFFGIEKNNVQNYTFDVLITGIREYLEDGTKNQIEVRNYLTSFEDLFQRISAATQTLQLNEQTYNKAAYFTKEGTVDKDILQNTLLSNSLTLANSSDNSYRLDETGLSLQSLINPARKMRAVADGIFFSNSKTLDGEIEWKTGITADGINASLLTTGQINTSLIKIYADGQPYFTWNQLGITAYKFNHNDGKIAEDSFIRFDSYGLYSVNGEGKNFDFNFDSEGAPWYSRYDSREETIRYIVENASVSVTDKGFRMNCTGNSRLKLGYLGKNENNRDSYGLEILGYGANRVYNLARFSTDGENEIGGWKITNNKLSTTVDIGDGELYTMCMNAPTKKTETVFAAGGDNHDSYANATFRVRADGQVWAKEITLSGSVIAGESLLAVAQMEENGVIKSTDSKIGFTFFKSERDIVDGQYPALFMSDKNLGKTVKVLFYYDGMVGALGKDHQTALKVKVYNPYCEKWFERTLLTIDCDKHESKVYIGSPLS